MLTSRAALRARSTPSRGACRPLAPAARGTSRLAALALSAVGAVALLTGCAGARAAARAAPVPLTPTSVPAFVSPPQAVSGLSLIVQVAPATVGTSTVLVTLQRADGTPVTHATVTSTTESLDMRMGTQTIALQPSGRAGSYRGQIDLSMVGNWAITVGVVPTGATQPVTVRVPFTVSLW